ncbi:Hypothetical protein LUCI_4461 [Lucifera butyrica]|uniref:Type 4 fimbrial biogenesis protein PilX N-terminal domain-containing protein n=1 Tax=Lucifera butyrica TaxID=1351585 RepID=A0A498RDV9_9FIRM|nr:hypothetical protein [Lucifera butyrica]VBB09175.1 Hypothetical protein LUCI_4461 [Lucifera butyrica]
MLRNQKGFATVLAVGVMVFLSLMIMALMPMLTAAIHFNSINRDGIEAQYAAEAGAKRAFAGFMNADTDWSWIGPNNPRPFTNATKTYEVSIPGITNGSAPATGNYTITSVGKVGNETRKVLVNVTYTSGGGGGSNVFKYATFSVGTMTVNQPQINGDIASNGKIIVNSSTPNTVNGTAYCNQHTIYTPSAVSSGFQSLTDNGNLDVNSLMLSMPNITESGTNITSTWANGEWYNGTYTLSDSAYYYDGNYGMYSYNYSVSEGQSVTIYVNGDLNLGKNITGDNITIYSTGNITFNGGSIEGSSNANIKIYAQGTITLNSGSNIIGGNVTVLANNSGKAYNAIAFNGGSINSTLENAVSKVYANGNCALNDVSVISGKGTGMLMATGDVSLNGGSAPQTVIIAGGNVAGNSGSKVAGIYADGILNMNGATVNYNSSVIQTLGIGGGGAPTFNINSYSDH